MKVSVIVPTYNRGYILGEALKSILEQSYKNIDVVVVDDGSTDDTFRVVQGISDGRVRYISHECNRGCSAAYNTGISAASGELIAFLDSDDVWKMEYLERQVSFLERQPESGAVFSDTEIREEMAGIPSLTGVMRAFRRTLRKYPPAAEYLLTTREMFLCLLEEVPIKPSALVIRKQILDDVGGFDEGWPSGTDWDLLLRCAGTVRFGYVDAPLVVQRRTGDATHRQFREQDKLFLLSIFLKQKLALEHDHVALRAVNRGICKHYDSLAWIYLESGRGRGALLTYWQGFKEVRKLRLLTKMAFGALRVALVKPYAAFPRQDLTPRRREAISTNTSKKAATSSSPIAASASTDIGASRPPDHE
jgi:glycosyltransferase involved in cell wall biosynthesis